MTGHRQAVDPKLAVNRPVFSFDHIASKSGRSETEEGGVLLDEPSYEILSSPAEKNCLFSPAPSPVALKEGTPELVQGKPSAPTLLPIKSLLPAINHRSRHPVFV